MTRTARVAALELASYRGRRLKSPRDGGGRMSGDARREDRTPALGPAALWMVPLALPGAARQRLSSFELDGYLTDIIVASILISPSRWMAGLWEDGEPIFDDLVQLQSRPAAAGVVFNTLSARIDHGLQRLEAERICDYCAAFQPAEGTPGHDAIRVWARGFRWAMELAPEDWIALAEDASLEPTLAPLVRFIDAGEEFEPAEDTNDRLDWAAANILRAILILRKIAGLRDGRATAPGPIRHTNLGRNAACPCVSSRKYKRYCGQG